MDPLLIALLALVAISVWRGYHARRTRRMLEAAGSYPDPRACWQCQSTEREPVEDLVSRCKGCGAIQGAGAGGYLIAKRRQGFLALSSAAREAQARALLLDSNLRLTALDGDLTAAIALLHDQALQSRGPDLSQLTSEGFGRTLFEIRQGQEQLLDIRELLASSEQVPLLDDALDAATVASLESPGGNSHQALMECLAHVANLRFVHKLLTRELSASGLDVASSRP